MQSSERRKSARAAFDGWVEVHTDGSRRLATGFDLSASGIGVILATEGLSARTGVTCEFALPDIQLPAAVDGAVAWSNGARMGVCFGEIDPGLAELLENFVAGRL